MKLLSGTLTLLAAAVMLLGNSSCASSKQEKSAITKVKYYHLDPSIQLRTLDRMISFEQQHYRHGAVDNEQLLEKVGHYYTVFWRNDNRDSDVKLRLDYRHQSTGPKEYSFEIQPDQVKRRNTTHFAVIGDAYQKLGAVTAWKASLYINGELVGEKKSFLWE
ncbi:MAG: hypothetical protein L3J39_09325 [Verrucomicrobiales bacterium]|nr:hypothetical protein [Verrucomicrobiales bacterium]